MTSKEAIETAKTLEKSLKIGKLIKTPKQSVKMSDGRIIEPNNEIFIYEETQNNSIDCMYYKINRNDSFMVNNEGLRQILNSICRDSSVLDEFDINIKKTREKGKILFVVTFI